MTSLPEDLKARAAKCTRCGSCLVVCPVAGRLHSEAAGARGKLQLIRALGESRLDAGVELSRLVNLCLLCDACSERCPSGVRTTDLFIRLRHELKTEVPLPRLKQMAFTGRTCRRLFDLAMRAGGLFQKALFRDAGHGQGVEARLPIPAAGLDVRRVVPRLGVRPLRSLVARKDGLKHPRAHVAFFPGCMLSYIYPEAGAAVVRTLRANNVRVSMPGDAGCCGTPMLVNGDFETATLLAERTIEALGAREFDAVVTACPTCGSALKERYELLPLSDGARATWEGFRGKVVDFSQFLAQTGLHRNMLDRERTVTYHDSCHMARSMKAKAEPRELLASLPGAELVEMRDAGACCGCGGTFSAENYGLSRRINDDKIRNIVASGASTVAMGCPACMMHIADGLARHGSDVRVVHTAQLLAEAYGPPRP
jgi:glycolate oxidase iron-sulfur subunit